SGCLQLIDGLEDAACDERCQSERRLVKEDKAGARHQSKAYGQHLLLPAGHCARKLHATLFQARKEAVNRFKAFLCALSRVLGKSSDAEVLLNAHEGKNHPAFGNEDNPSFHAFVALTVRDIFVPKQYSASPYAH